jgi:glycosyltransferase involved in cell wall biosynthesis
MRIAFLPGSCVPFDGTTLTRRPLGGTETAIIRLAESLSRMGHKVYVFTPKEHPPVTNPLYIPYRALPDLGTVDIAVTVRDSRLLFSGVTAKAQYFWTGDSYDQIQHLGLGDRRVIRMLTALLAVSNWQADRLCAISGFPRDRSYILRNGHFPEFFNSEVERSPYRLVYSSTPYRGLSLLLPIFTELKRRIPEVELHVFSGMAVYDEEGSNRSEGEKPYRVIYDRLANTPGITLHGNVLQDQLAIELQRSRLMTYPNTFEETSCIAAIEALAAGCPVVTSRRGALPETIAESGVFIEGEPTTPLYQMQFVQAVDNILRDEKAWEHLHQRALKRSLTTTWDYIAHNLTEKFAHDIHTTNVSHP